MERSGMPGLERSLIEVPQGRLRLFSRGNNSVPFQNHLQFVVKIILRMILRLKQAPLRPLRPLRLIASPLLDVKCQVLKNLSWLNADC